MAQRGRGSTSSFTPDQLHALGVVNKGTFSHFIFYMQN